MFVDRAREEVEAISLGDHRLNMRVIRTVERMAQSPAAPYPQMFSSAERQGLDHLLSHREVTPALLIQPHYNNTVERAASYPTVFAAHDSTNVQHAGGAKGQDFYDLSTSTYGYVAHATLIISPDRCPLGVGNLSFIGRSKERNKRKKRKRSASESDRWMEAVRDSENRFVGQSLIHLMDSEADSYDIIANLVRGNHRFIVRGDERKIAVHNDKKWTKASLLESLEQKPVLLRREVPLSARKVADHQSKRNPPRESRTATLSVRTGRVHLQRPDNVPGTGKYGQPIRLSVNVVLVQEEGTPEGQTPVCWVLFTSEPIETIEEAEAVIDGYRTRWLIEEFFKCLKTGCAFEQRRFALQHNSRNALALTLPLAWQLLLLRYMQRQHSTEDARILLGPELPVLRLIAREKLPVRPTVDDVITALAELGGHRKADGPPGCIVLARGLAQLNTAVRFARLLRREPSGRRRESDL